MGGLRDDAVSATCAINLIGQRAMQAASGERYFHWVLMDNLNGHWAMRRASGWYIVNYWKRSSERSRTAVDGFAK